MIWINANGAVSVTVQPLRKATKKWCVFGRIS